MGLGSLAILTMRTLSLSEAADFLGLHPVTLQERARAGVVPGAKVGRAWRFLDVDLVEYMRAQYPSSQKQPHKQPYPRAGGAHVNAQRGSTTG